MPGLLLLAQNGGDLVLKSIAPRALRPLGFRTALISGSLMITVSIIVCAFLTSGISFPVLFLIMFAVGMARSVHLTAQMALRFADMPQSEVGGATVLGNMIQSLSQAFAISGVAAMLSLLSDGAEVPTMLGFPHHHPRPCRARAHLRAHVRTAGQGCRRRTDRPGTQRD